MPGNTPSRPPRSEPQLIWKPGPSSVATVMVMAWIIAVRNTRGLVRAGRSIRHDRRPPPHSYPFGIYPLGRVIRQDARKHAQPASPLGAPIDLEAGWACF